MDAIHLSKGELDGHSILKLQVGEFVRKLPIPAESSSIDASLNDGIPEHQMVIIGLEYFQYFQFLQPL